MNMPFGKHASDLIKVSEQFGVQFTADFVKVTEYEQLSLDFRKGGGAALNKHSLLMELDETNSRLKRLIKQKRR